MMTISDSFDKSWSIGLQDPLGDYIQAHKLVLTIEYKKEAHVVWFICKVRDRPTRRSRGHLLIDIKSTKPMSDSDILLKLISRVRARKIKSILK